MPENIEAEELYLDTIQFSDYTYKIRDANAQQAISYLKTDIMDKLDDISDKIDNIPSSNPTVISKTITQNGTYTAEIGVDGYSPIIVNVKPEKGMVFDNYNANGFPTTVEFVGPWGTIPANFFSYFGYTNSSAFSNISRIKIPDGCLTLSNNAFFRCKNVQEFILPDGLLDIGPECFYESIVESFNIPSSVRTIGNSAFFNNINLKQIIFPQNVSVINYRVVGSCTSLESFIALGNIVSIGNQAFHMCSSLMLYDFSNCTSVPTLYSAASLVHASGCIIKVPSSLLSTWQTSNNWNALTDVVWQGV